MSCVGLWRGLIARSTFGPAMRTLAANSLTPIARITFPSASCRSTPSSIYASRNSRPNEASRSSFASPTFRSSLRLATRFALLIRLSGLLRSRHVRRLGGPVATEQQEHELRGVLAEVDPIPWPKHAPRFPDAAAHARDRPSTRHAGAAPKVGVASVTPTINRPRRSRTVSGGPVWDSNSEQCPLLTW